MLQMPDMELQDPMFFLLNTILVLIESFLDAFPSPPWNEMFSLGLALVEVYHLLFEFTRTDNEGGHENAFRVKKNVVVQRDEFGYQGDKEWICPD